MRGEIGEVLRAVFWFAKVGFGCDEWKGEGISVGMISWVEVKGGERRGEVMTVPKGENEEGVSGESGIVSGGDVEKVVSVIV